MMQINLTCLSLICKQSKEVINLSAQVNFFHGKVSSGKSSIARLINFCLGGTLERTIAIQKEVISASLELTVGSYRVLLERNADNNTYVVATWIADDDTAFTANIPINSSENPVYADSVYSLSDLFFHLLDIKIPKIPRNSLGTSASLTRLTLRNFMWYCYLDQSKLDSSFFRHEDGTKARNSKELLKYILQYTTQKLLDLQEKLLNYRKLRFTHETTTGALNGMLEKLDFSGTTGFEHVEEQTKSALADILLEKQTLETKYRSDTHFVDHLKIEIRSLFAELVSKEEAIIELETRIDQQQTLRSELVSTKFKVSRSQSISNIFQDIDFVSCPSCGTSISDRQSPERSCKLCLSPQTEKNDVIEQQAETIQVDLNERIKELDASIDLHKKSLTKTRKEYYSKKIKREQLDRQLEHDLEQYESVFLSNIRSIDTKIATLRERLNGIERLKLIPLEISRLRDEVNRIRTEEAAVKQQILNEQKKITRGELLISELEETFLKILVEVGMPGIHKDDRVEINRKNFDVHILPVGEEYLRWNFYNAGSGGKKTLFNSCFLLALHVVASNNDLPIPTLIIIDTPMKNIDKEVNQDIFKSFYDYLYQLASDVLDKTQFIIIDNNYIPPSRKLGLSFMHRYMAAGDPENPPLIPYYNGP